MPLNQHRQDPGALSITLTNQMDATSREKISGQLDRFNVVQTGISDNTVLDVILKDTASNAVIGGLVGRTSLGIFFINYLVLPEELRGQGLGRDILLMAEREAGRRGCSEVVLFTMNIQAPGFYEKNGYQVFGTIPCDPPGNARIFMRKKLVPGTK